MAGLEEVDFGMEDEDWDDADEEEMAPVPALCLFCDLILPDTEHILNHCSEKHSFNIHRMRTLHNLDCFAFIKMINFIRSKVSSFS